MKERIVSRWSDQEENKRILRNLAISSFLAVRYIPFDKQLEHTIGSEYVVRVTEVGRRSLWVDK
jgi:hypothetical protein